MCINNTALDVSNNYSHLIYYYVTKMRTVSAVSSAAASSKLNGERLKVAYFNMRDAAMSHKAGRIGVNGSLVLIAQLQAMS